MDLLSSFVVWCEMQSFGREKQEEYIVNSVGINQTYRRSLIQPPLEGVCGKSVGR